MPGPPKAASTGPGPRSVDGLASPVELFLQLLCEFIDLSGNGGLFELDEEFGEQSIHAARAVFIVFVLICVAQFGPRLLFIVLCHKITTQVLGFWITAVSWRRGVAKKDAASDSGFRQA